MTVDQGTQPTAEERMQEFPEPPTQAVDEVKRWNRIMVICLLIAGVAMATSLIVAAFAIGGQSEAGQRANRNFTAAQEAKATASAAAGQASVAVSAAEEANRRLRAAGKPTVPVPTITVSAPPPVVAIEGLNGQQLLTVQSLIESALARYQPSMSAAQIQQAAAAAASLVPKPKDGHTPTAAELQPLVIAAQAAFCAGGRCDGKTGATGPVGPSGAPGANGSPGADAPAVTDEQLKPLIVSALAAYCESQPGGTCKGLTGDTGATGARGFQGKNFAGMDCMSDGRWRYYIADPSDGSQETFYTDGPCRIAVLPSEALRTR